MSIKCAVVAAVIATLAGPLPARADCQHDETLKIVPLPVWATSPNEGNTWGAMPVFVRVCPDDQRTLWVIAPSVTWNSVIHYSATVRFFDYIDPVTTLTVIAGASTRINRRLVVAWEHVPDIAGEWTDEANLRLEDNAFSRFFGLGYQSRESGETTYTTERALASERRGYAFAHHLNLGLTLGVQADGIGHEGVKDLPLAPDVYPNVPGMRGSTVIWQGLDLRYDDRDLRDLALRGLRLDGSIAVVEGLSRSPTFVRGGLEGRVLFPELSWLQGALRAGWMATSASDAPFYLQSELGGSFVLRGFTEGRFVAKQAWTVELEQRVRALRTHIFGVVADWRLDPFITAGQVFDRVEDALAKPQIAGGVGLRVYVHPRLAGRVDLAEGGEGLKVYVEIGYPF